MYSSKEIEKFYYMQGRAYEMGGQDEELPTQVLKNQLILS